MKNRNFAIELVKFIAVFLIINSHADIMYPRFSALATGGAIGDALFLFASGFTLFLSSKRSFDNYYKRRISRIYPSVISAGLFCMLISYNYGVHILRHGGGEFILAIMIYYVLLYFVQRYLIQYIKWVFWVVVGITLVVYTLYFPYKYETGTMGIYGISTLFRWIPYFNLMLIGAYTGLNYSRLKCHATSDFLKTMACLVLFYGIQMSAKIIPSTAPLQILSIFPLYGIVVYLFRWCHADWGMKLAESKYSRLILGVSGLCLESYLIQFVFFTDGFNNIWPLNILAVMVVILVCSYVVRCGARFLLQTFRTEDYNWNAIFKI